MRVPTPDINDTTATHPRTQVQAFGPYAAQTPIYEDDNPYNLGDLCTVLLCLLIVLLVVL